MMLAVASGAAAAVRVLLDAGADAHRPDAAHRTVLTAAVASGQLSIAAELVSHGAPFAGEAAGLKAAAAEGRVGELQRLLDAGVPADYAEVGR